MQTVWKRKFVWLPVFVENGDPARFGMRWLTFVWFRLCNASDESRYQRYWKAATHNWDEE